MKTLAKNNLLYTALCIGLLAVLWLDQTINSAAFMILIQHPYIFHGFCILEPLILGTGVFIVSRISQSCSTSLLFSCAFIESIMLFLSADVIKFGLNSVGIFITEHPLKIVILTLLWLNAVPSTPDKNRKNV